MTGQHPGAPSGAAAPSALRPGSSKGRLYGETVANGHQQAPAAAPAAHGAHHHNPYTANNHHHHHHGHRPPSAQRPGYQPATGAPYVQAQQHQVGGGRPTSAGPPPSSHNNERPSSAAPLRTHATGGGGDGNHLIAALPPSQRPGANMPRPATVASARECHGDAKMVPTGTHPGRVAHLHAAAGDASTAQAAAHAAQAASASAAAAAAQAAQAAAAAAAAQHGHHQPNLVPRQEQAAWLAPRNGGAAAVGSSPRDSNNSLGSLQTGTGFARATAEQQQQPQANGGGTGAKEDDETVRQQLLSLALRACRTGGTGVGEGVGMPVGLSELYKLGKAIGEGAFGFVRVAQQRLSRELIAVKTFEKVRLRDNSSRRRLENEIRVLQRIRHPYIVRLYEVFESPKRIHLCMEHVSHGTLHRHLTQHKRLPEGEVRRLVRQLVGALAYLHARSIAHRDIKLENVLLDEWCNCKLIDFGFAILSRGKLRVPCGSPAYTAPEILLAHEYDGQLADVWSLGVLIYVMLAGRFPFQGATRAELSRNVLRGSFASPSGLSREPESLLRRVLVRRQRDPPCTHTPARCSRSHALPHTQVLDPHQRYTIENVRAHPWMQRRPTESEIVTEHTSSQKIEAPIREQMLMMGLPSESIDASLAAERHDHLYTTALLLLRKKKRQEAVERGPQPPPPPESASATQGAQQPDARAAGPATELAIPLQ